MGRRLLTVAALLATAILPAACSAMMRVTVTGSLEQPVAIFGFDPAKPERACLDSISVYELGDPPRIAWEIRRERGCLRLRQIAYGDTPRGFDVHMLAQALKPGVRYEVSVSGQTGGIANVPWSGGGGYVFENGQWRSTN